MIVQPVDRGEAVELVETIQLYAPGTGCWQYDRSQTPKFRAITDADVDSWLNEPPAGATATMPAKPSVHVAPTSVERVLTAPAQRRATPTHEQTRPAPKAPEVTTRRSSLLSEEEFQLLLGDVDVAGFPTPTPAPRVHPDQHGTSTRGDGGSIGGGGR